MKKLPHWIAAVLRTGGILHIFSAIGLIFYSAEMLTLLQKDLLLLPPSDWWIRVSGLGLLVLGTGYFISSFNPLRNTVSLLMGLLSHLLGAAFLLGQLGSPVFGSSLLAGSLMGFIFVWIGLNAFILYFMSQARTIPQSLTHTYSEPLAKTLSRFRTQKGKNLLQLSNKQPVLLVFLKQFDGPLGLEALKDIEQKKALIEGEGTRLVLVHLSEEERAQEFFSRAGLEEVQRISDPNGIMYSAFGLDKSSYTQQTGWRGGMQRITLLLQSYRISEVLGTRPGMPGIFLINQGEIVKSYRKGQSGSRPDFASLAACEAA